jgi:hypothetical protein
MVLLQILCKGLVSQYKVLFGGGCSSGKMGMVKREVLRHEYLGCLLGLILAWMWYQAKKAGMKEVQAEMKKREPLEKKLEEDPTFIEKLRVEMESLQQQLAALQ